MLQAREAARKYKNPHRKLKFIGVTGTDGKTSVANMVYHILHASNRRVGIISTTSAKFDGKEIDTGLHVTTPDPWDLPRYLDDMYKAGIEYVVVEATSMGLHQNRLGDIRFITSIITNIKADHLDYHKTWEKYAKAKLLIIKRTVKGGKVVLNSMHKKSADWLFGKIQKMKRKKLQVNWIGTDEVEIDNKSRTELHMLYKGSEYTIPVFPSDYNVVNVLQAIAATESIVSPEEIQKSLSTFVSPEGRMELITTKPANVLVDFAHTPSSLEAALKSINKVKSKNSKLIVLFGCAGKRDKSRRKMGAVAAKHANVVVLTAEDPRNEKVSDINSEIADHAKDFNGKIIQRFPNTQDYELTNLGEVQAKIMEAEIDEQKPVICFDENTLSSRKDAIRFAVRIAKRGDFVLITGKGHEKSLAFGANEKEYQWSDQEEVLLALKNRGRE